jgi:hypothetical protein
LRLGEGKMVRTSRSLARVSDVGGDAASNRVWTRTIVSLAATLFALVGAEAMARPNIVVGLLDDHDTLSPNVMANAKRANCR